MTELARPLPVEHRRLGPRRGHDPSAPRERAAGGYPAERSTRPPHGYEVGEPAHPGSDRCTLQREYPAFLLHHVCWMNSNCRPMLALMHMKKSPRSAPSSSSASSASAGPYTRPRRTIRCRFASSSPRAGSGPRELRGLLRRIWDPIGRGQHDPGAGHLPRRGGAPAHDRLQPGTPACPQHDQITACRTRHDEPSSR